MEKDKISEADQSSEAQSEFVSMSEDNSQIDQVDEVLDQKGLFSYDKWYSDEFDELWPTSRDLEDLEQNKAKNLLVHRQEIEKLIE
jgi:hypothetical protein